MELRATTQAELDAILARQDLNFDDFEIVIDSPRGVWITISDGRGLDVEAYGSATVRAYDSTTVEAYDSTTVEAYGSATVRAYDSATVRAYGSATVRAYDSTTVEASGSATVRASGSATVQASGSATVQAYGSATVRAYDSATVRAYDSTTVEAGSYVAVHLFSQKVTLSGGVLIDMTALDRYDPTMWCDLAGVHVDSEGLAHLYKAVDIELYAGHSHVKTQYPIGGDPECDIWRDNHDCGFGLHVYPTAWLAKDHYREATRFLEVTVPVADLRPIYPTKAKARTVHVLREVDLSMKPTAPVFLVGGEVKKAIENPKSIY